MEYFLGVFYKTSHAEILLACFHNYPSNEKPWGILQNECTSIQHMLPSWGALVNRRVNKQHLITFIKLTIDSGCIRMTIDILVEDVCSIPIAPLRFLLCVVLSF